MYAALFAPAITYWPISVHLENIAHLSAFLELLACTAAEFNISLLTYSQWNITVSHSLNLHFLFYILSRALYYPTLSPIQALRFFARPPSRIERWFLLDSSHSFVRVTVVILAMVASHTKRWDIERSILLCKIN